MDLTNFCFTARHSFYNYEHWSEFRLEVIIPEQVFGKLFSATAGENVP